jgi:hypothetical protein
MTESNGLDGACLTRSLLETRRRASWVAAPYRSLVLKYGSSRCYPKASMRRESDDKKREKGRLVRPKAICILVAKPHQMDSIRIRCPKCVWEPDGKPYWRCSCGHRWDTFSTGGRCPKCQHVWEDTQCPNEAGGCRQWSPHLDWYEHLDGMVEEIREIVDAPAEVEKVKVTV